LLLGSQHVWNELQCNEYYGYFPMLLPMSNQHDAHGFLSKQNSRYGIAASHHKTAPLVAIVSCPDRKLKPNCTFID
jgi:hypothetical protein